MISRISTASASRGRDSISRYCFLREPTLTNQFTLLETIIELLCPAPGVHVSDKNFCSSPPSIALSRSGADQNPAPSPNPAGKEQEIKVTLLNASRGVNCARDAPMEFGDVIEVPDKP